MKRIVIEVIKFNNKDVITTSELCLKHSDKKHAHSYGKTIDGITVDVYEIGSVTKTGDLTIRFGSFSPNEGIKSAVGKWYYYDGDSWKVCEGDHSGYTIVDHDMK